MKKDKDFIFNKICIKAFLLYEEYRFLGFNKDSFNVLVYDVIDKYISSFKDIPSFYDSILKKINESLDNAVKVKAENNLIGLCNSFVQNCFFPANNYAYAIKNFNKFRDMFFSDNLNFNPSDFSDFILNNNTFDSNLELIVNKNMNYIKNGTLSMCLDDDVLYSFIEMYCINHNIEFDLFDIDNIMKVTSNDLILYKKQMGRYPVLKPEEEIELFEKYQNGDLGAKEKLINSNLRFVLKVASNYIYSGIPFPDLVQEGNIGLITAVEKFDLSRNTRFSTYAFWWIRQAVKRAVDNYSSVIRIPVHLREKYPKFRRTFGILSDALGRNPTEYEIADEMGIPINDVITLMNINFNCASLNDKYGDDDSDSELGDFVPDASLDLAEEINNRILNSEIFEFLKKSGLSDREILVLSYRYGLADGSVRTLEWIGEKLGITRERVRQLEMKALARIRNNPGVKKFANYMDNPEAAIDFVNSCKGKSYGRERFKRQVQNSHMTDKKEEEIKGNVDSKKIKNRRNENMGAKKKTLYETLDFEKTLVEEVLKYLSAEEIEYLKVRFGSDYEHPSDQSISKEENGIYYNSIRPKMIKIAKKLRKGEKIEGGSMKKRKKSNVSDKPVNENHSISDTPVNNNSVVQNNEVDEITVENNQVDEGLIDEDFKFSLDVTQIAKNIKLDDLSPLQMTILTLKLGHVNGKIFTNAEISEFLGVSVEEIIEITKFALESYRSYIISLVNQEFDKVIYDVSNVRTRSDK